MLPAPPSAAPVTSIHAQQRDTLNSRLVNAFTMKHTRLRGPVPVLTSSPSLRTLIPAPSRRSCSRDSAVRETWKVPGQKGETKKKESPHELVAAMECWDGNLSDSIRDNLGDLLAKCLMTRVGRHGLEKGGGGGEQTMITGKRKRKKESSCSVQQHPLEDFTCSTPQLAKSVMCRDR